MGISEETNKRLGLGFFTNTMTIQTDEGLSEIKIYSLRNDILSEVICVNDQWKFRTNNRQWKERPTRDHLAIVAHYKLNIGDSYILDNDYVDERKVSEIADILFERMQCNSCKERIQISIGQRAEGSIEEISTWLRDLFYVATLVGFGVCALLLPAFVYYCICLYKMLTH